MRVPRSAAILLAVLSFAAAAAGPSVPPAPSRFVTDKAGVLSAKEREALEERLQAFEDDTSNQFLVYVDRKVPEGTTLEEFTVTAAQAWRVGQKEQRNGLVLFVFPEDKVARFEVGRGLEGALPDVLAGRILDGELIPRAKTGDWDAAISSAVEAAIAATKGEYKGTGERARRRDRDRFPWGFVLFLVVFVLPLALGRRRRNYWYLGGGGFGSGGFGGGFGGFGGGGGGGFSGGGGSFGGGGASGRW